MYINDDKDKWFSGQFLKAVLDVDLNSVPGYCILREFGTTNRQVFNVNESGEYDFSRLQLVYRLVKNRFNNLSESDPIYTFVKPEPHKKSKIDDKRFRLISGISLLDSLVDRILFMALVDGIKNRVTLHPIAVGWSPVRSHIFHFMMRGKHKNYLCIDKSSWDWTVHKWLIDLVKLTLKQLVIQPPSWWLEAVDKRFSALFENPIWKFQDGSVIRQKEPGIMKSGCYLTIWFNSISQMILHRLATISTRSFDGPFLCLGDDTIQVLEDQKDYLQFMSDLGFDLKVHNLRFPEFCGFIFSNIGYLPAYLSKHQFLLQHLVEDDEIATQTLQSYQLLYKNDANNLARIRNLARR